MLFDVYRFRGGPTDSTEQVGHVEAPNAAAALAIAERKFACDAGHQLWVDEAEPQDASPDSD